MLLIDPKKVEFTPYHEVPHLLAPVITDGEEANRALKVIVQMMDERYELFAKAGVRNIASYNANVEAHPQEHHQKLASIVVIIDELADLMLVAAKEVESSIQRITQLARAAGIHLIVATQRPECGCYHRCDQSQYSFPHRICGLQCGRLPYDPGSDGRRKAAGLWRYAVSAGR